MGVMYKVYFLQDNTIDKGYCDHIEAVVQDVYQHIHKVLGVESCEIIVSSQRSSLFGGELFRSFLCDADSFYLYGNSEMIQSASREAITTNLKEHLYNGLYATARICRLGLAVDCGLREEVVGEGLSAHFVCEQLGKKPSTWYTHLEKEKIPAFLTTMRSEAPGNGLYEKWFRGSEEEGIPPFTAHALGYHAVAAYLKKTRKASIHALGTPAKEILVW